MGDAAPRDEGDGPAYVAVPLPAGCVLVSFALAAAARVVQEYAVARLREHPRVEDRSLAVAAAAVHEHDRGAVAGRHIPAGQVNAVACRKGDSLVRQPQRSAIDRCTRL